MVFSKWSLGGSTILCLTAQDAEPRWQVTPHLQLPLALWQRRSTVQLRKNPAMNDCPAAGIVCWRECQGRLDMLPLVHMHNTQTSCLENTCGSGALSLVRTGGRRDFFICSLTVLRWTCGCYDNGADHIAAVSGAVILVDRGRVWLQEEYT